MYSVYYFYCFNVTNLAFRDSLDKEGVRSACMTGIQIELKNLYSTSYPGVNMLAVKVDPNTAATDTQT